MQHPSRRDRWGASRSRGEGPGRRIIHLHQPPPPPPPYSAPVPGTESDNEASTDHHYHDHHYHGSRELELERDHYTVHSQYYHPERQRRSDWGSRDARLHSLRDLPPFAAYHELASSYGEEGREQRRERGAVWSSASGDSTERYFPLQSTSIPHRVAPTPEDDHSHSFPMYPPPPPPLPPHYHSTASHLYPQSSFYSSSSSSTTSLPSSSHDNAPRPMHHSADKVSAVDLIKSSRGEVEGYMYPTTGREEEEGGAGEQGGVGLVSSFDADICSVDRPSCVDRGDPVPYMEGMGMGPEEWSWDRGVGVVPYDVAGQVECVQEVKQKERREEEEREEEREEEEGEMEEWKVAGQERDKQWVGEAKGGEGEREGGSEEAMTVSGYENSFVAEVWKFVQRNADMFNIITETNTPLQLEPTLHNLKSEAKCEQSVCLYHVS